MTLPISAPHSWVITPRQAIALQKELASLVIRARPPGQLRYVAGLDAAFSPDNCFCIGAVVLWDRQERIVLEKHTAHRKVTFPYIPGLLSFREAPALLAALGKLQQSPDVLLCDGQGLAHPRRFGIACHLGLVCQLPAIGCAKSRLIGAHAELPQPRGSRVPLIDKGETVGEVLRPQTGLGPLYVSLGHKIDLPTAEQIVLDCAVRYRLPEPIRLADRLVAAIRRNWAPAQ